MSHNLVEPTLKDLVVPLPRMSLNPPLAVKQLADPGDSAKFFGYAVNITREGIFVPTMNPKPPGFQTRVSFELPGGKAVIETEIEVVWSRGYNPKDRRTTPAGMGMRFVNLAEDKKCLIDTFMGGVK